jgi:hypothetical protein
MRTYVSYQADSPCDFQMRTSKQSNSDITPCPSRLLNSLRDVGYEFKTAIADIVDNSIAAGARRVDVSVHHSAESVHVLIADNGTGMTETQLVESLRLGSARKYGSTDLGKFGLGLKTASLSQCRRLIVVSRHSQARRRLASATLDIDVVATAGDWSIGRYLDPQLAAIASKWLNTATGTVVIWQQMDRVVRTGEPSGWDRRRLDRLAESTASHLAMVFHRFLEGTHGTKKLRLTVNGQTVTPWNPFASEEKHTRALTPHRFELCAGAATAEIRIQGYVLPPRDKFSSTVAFERMSGPNKWNRQQGFYIYRNNRLIQGGGWCGLRAADEHTKLARIALDVPSALDELFTVNIAKMRVSLPGEVRAMVDRAVQETAKEAQVAYRGPLRLVSGGVKRLQKLAGRSQRISDQPLADFMIALRGAAIAMGESRSLGRLLAHVATHSPAFAHTLGIGRSPAKTSKKRRLPSKTG